MTSLEWGCLMRRGLRGFLVVLSLLALSVVVQSGCGGDNPWDPTGRITGPIFDCARDNFATVSFENRTNVILNVVWDGVVLVWELDPGMKHEVFPRGPEAGVQHSLVFEAWGTKQVVCEETTHTLEQCSFHNFPCDG